MPALLLIVAGALPDLLPSFPMLIGPVWHGRRLCHHTLCCPDLDRASLWTGRGTGRQCYDFGVSRFHGFRRDCPPPLTCSDRRHGSAFCHPVCTAGDCQTTRTGG